ncbi:MAG: hypothetical protein AAB249_03025 [Acidobacteriota bacterium]
MSRHLLRPVSLVLGLSLVLGPGAYAEDPPAAAPPPEGSAAPRDTDTINRIMQDNEAMLTGRGFTYDPAGRRDPFRSLVDAMNAIGRGPRPRGIAGMLISEVDLVGIVQKGKSHIAFFNGSDNKGYFMKVGDTLYDGKIIRIDRRTGTVLFRQDINDPRSIKPYRDVAKRLTTAEEGSL